MQLCSYKADVVMLFVCAYTLYLANIIHLKLVWMNSIRFKWKAHLHNWLSWWRPWTADFIYFPMLGTWPLRYSSTLNIVDWLCLLQYVEDGSLSKEVRDGQVAITVFDYAMKEIEGMMTSSITSHCRYLNVSFCIRSLFNSNFRGPTKFVLIMRCSNYEMF